MYKTKKEMYEKVYELLETVGLQKNMQIDLLMSFLVVKDKESV